jgi:hypothetical protein
MAFVTRIFTTPQSTPQHAYQMIWTWKEALKEAGWTHFASGTGTGGTFTITPGNVNDLIVTANNLTPNNAWFVLRDPGARRQIMVHRSTIDPSMRIYMSATSTFVGTGFGAISATVPPSAVDQVQLFGSAGGFGFWTNLPTVTITICAETVPVGNVYPFHLMVVNENDFTRGTQCFACEPMDPASYSMNDVEPCLWMCGNLGSLYSTTASPWWGWYRYGQTGAAWARHTALMANRQSSDYRLLNPEIASGTWPLFPFAWVGTGAQNAWKGWSRYLRQPTSTAVNWPNTLMIDDDLPGKVVGQAQSSTGMIFPFPFPGRA